MSDALRLPWKVRMMLNVIAFSTYLSARSNGTVNRLIANLLDFKSAPLSRPNNGLKSFDLTVDPSRNLWFRLYTPTSASTSGLDPLIDWQKRYYEGLKKSGKEAYLIEYPNAFHAFYAFPELPQWNAFIKEVAVFVKKKQSP